MLLCVHSEDVEEGRKRRREEEGKERYEEDQKGHTAPKELKNKKGNYSRRV